jgi:ketosteroid isomerase-like protein
MKKIVVSILLLFLTNAISAQNNLKEQIATTLNAWHKAAAEANYDNYFNLLSDDAIFIGTDATENWTKSAFEAYSKPYFDKGKAWSFTAIERNIYFNNDKTLAWFDELLDTQMKICRGSGVMVFIKGQWKIKQYVLSMTVPNDNVDEVVKIKAPTENLLIATLKEKK